MRRTKIVCTIGPASRSRERLSELIAAGMDVARLNMSHGTHEEHGAVIGLIRTLATELGRNVAVLLDLSGPKIRLGQLKEPIFLKSGDVVVLTTENVVGEGMLLPVNYPNLLTELHPGDGFSMADGTILMEVETVTATEAHARVLSNGPLSSHKGINLPLGGDAIPALTEKDKDDLRFGLQAGVDWVALSFVRSSDDAAAPRAIMDEVGIRVPLLAKIEKRKALDRIDEILGEFDGLMVARGDLGVEVLLEDVPAIQKALIARANRAAKPVITATQMLLSMVSSPRPTRAEVTDVANAILDGTDAVMLSEETAQGEDPAHVVRTMVNIVNRAETMQSQLERQDDEFSWRRGPLDRMGRAPLPIEPGTTVTAPPVMRTSVPDAIARGTGFVSSLVGASLIITPTEGGSTARLICSQRPPVPILALTSRPTTARSMALYWGVIAKCTEPFTTTERLLQTCRKMALETGLAKPGDRVVVTSGLPMNAPGTTNILEVLEL